MAETGSASVVSIIAGTSDGVAVEAIVHLRVSDISIVDSVSISTLETGAEVVSSLKIVEAAGLVLMRFLLAGVVAVSKALSPSGNDLTFLVYFLLAGTMLVDFTLSATTESAGYGDTTTAE